MKTRKNKTLKKLESIARRRHDWIKKVANNAGPVLKRLATFFALPNNITTPSASNRITIEYIGPETAEGVLAARTRLAKVLGVLDTNDCVVKKCARATFTFHVTGVPVLSVNSKAA